MGFIYKIKLQGDHKQRNVGSKGATSWYRLPTVWAPWNIISQGEGIGVKLANKAGTL